MTDVTVLQLNDHLRCFNMRCTNKSDDGTFGVVNVNPDLSTQKGFTLIGCQPCCLELKRQLEEYPVKYNRVLVKE